MQGVENKLAPASLKHSITHARGTLNRGLKPMLKESVATSAYMKASQDFRAKAQKPTTGHTEVGITCLA